MMTPKKQQLHRSGNTPVPIALGVAIVVVFAFGVFYLYQSLSGPPMTERTDRGSGTAVADSDYTAPATKLASDSTNEDPEIEFERARAAMSEARSSHAAARLALSNAESTFEELEGDLADLERWVEELEERGEDPANHADEGMERFMPAFEAYERADLALDRAESAEAIERMKMQGAEKRFDATRLRLEGRP